MKTEEINLYKKAPILLAGFFICMSIILIYLNNPFAKDASLPLTYWALLAFTCACFGTFGTVGGAKILLPVTAYGKRDESLQVWQENNISTKVILFTTVTITTFFIVLWLISPVSFSLLVEWIPFWYALTGGISIGLLTSLLLIGMLKQYIKNNTKPENGTNKRISFRDG